jgi:helicase
MGLVGDAAAAIASGRTDDPRRSSSLKEIRFAATFFDAYIDAQLDERVRDEFALLAACSYYLADLPGNARLLVSRIAEPSSQGADGLDWLTFKLLRSSFDLADTDRAQRPRLATALLSLQLYQTARGDPEPLLEATQTLRSEAYDGGDGRALLYGDLVAAIAKKKIANSARTVLPTASDLALEVWAPVLQKASSITELWPAQMRICDVGLLRGRSAVVQMPTSAGKTRATELIIRSAFLANRTSLAVIVSPFRALQQTRNPPPAVFCCSSRLFNMPDAK